jgi:hypothetical protein
VVVNGEVLLIVIVPVAELTDIPVPADKETTPMFVMVFPFLFKPVEKVKAFSFELKVVQLEAVRSPLLDAEAEGRLKV